MANVTNTLVTRLVICNDTTANWGSSTKVLLKGELGIEFVDGGTPKVKVGDGSNTFENLPYLTKTPKEIEDLVANKMAEVHSHTNKAILDAITESFTTELKTKYDSAVDKANSAVQSVKITGSETELKGANGVVVLPAYPTKASLGLANVANTAPEDMPISTATQSALDAKADAATTYTKIETEKKIADAIAAADHLKREIVEALPEVSAGKGNVIYMVAKESGSGEQMYDEFMLINGVFEKIGDSAVDLTGYAKESWTNTTIDTKIATKVGAIGDNVTVKSFVESGDSATLSAAKGYADGLATNYATAAQGAKADTAIQSVKITGSSVELKNGTDVVLPAYPTTLPASDVHEWAKAESKPTYTAAEVGLGNVDNTRDSVKSVASAAILTNGRNFSITGAATAAAVSFNGSGDVALNVTEIDAASLRLKPTDVLVLNGGNAGV